MLTQDDHAAIGFVLEEIYTLGDLDDFVVTAMKLLPPLIGSDKASYNEVDYAERRMMTVIDSPFAQRRYHEKQLVFESIMNQNPLIEHYSNVLDGPRRISDFLTDEQWRSTGIYQAYYGDIKGDYQIAVALPIDRTTIVAFAFNRTVSDFDDRQLEILTILQPHLTQAYKNARQHTQLGKHLRRSKQVLETMGAAWMDLDENRVIVSTVPGSVAILATFFDQSFSVGDRLPPALDRWVVQSRDQALRARAVDPMVLSNEAGRLILRLLPPGKTGDTSLMMERFLAAASPEPLEKLGLTSRQAEVLYWICQGKSNAEIAVILKVAVRTVVFHVSRILEALGASNRTEAANLAVPHLMTRG